MTLEKETKYEGLNWENVDIEHKETIERKDLKSLLKHLAKLPKFPQQKRGIIWIISSGMGKFFEEKPNFYKESLEIVFGNILPEKIQFIPTFGFHFNTKPFKNLSELQIESAKRVLVLLRMEHDSCQFVPILPNFVLLLSHFLEEKFVYLLSRKFLSKEFNNPNNFNINYNINENLIYNFHDVENCKKKLFLFLI